MRDGARGTARAHTQVGRREGDGEGVWRRRRRVVEGDGAGGGCLERTASRGGLKVVGSRRHGAGDGCLKMADSRQWARETAWAGARVGAGDGGHAFLRHSARPAGAGVTQDGGCGGHVLEARCGCRPGGWRWQACILEAWCEAGRGGGDSRRWVQAQARARARARAVSRGPS